VRGADRACGPKDSWRCTVATCAPDGASGGCLSQHPHGCSRAVAPVALGGGHSKCVGTVPGGQPAGLYSEAAARHVWGLGGVSEAGLGHLHMTEQGVGSLDQAGLACAASKHVRINAGWLAWPCHRLHNLCCCERRMPPHLAIRGSACPAVGEGHAVGQVVWVAAPCGAEHQLPALLQDDKTGQRQDGGSRIVLDAAQHLISSKHLPANQQFPTRTRTSPRGPCRLASTGEASAVRDNVMVTLPAPARVAVNSKVSTSPALTPGSSGCRGHAHVGAVLSRCVSHATSGPIAPATRLASSACKTAGWWRQVSPSNCLSPLHLATN